MGHRGAAGLAPQNTRAGFKAAIATGVDWIEFDVRATKDGRVILMHDKHTLRTSPRLHLVSRTPYHTLRQLKTYSKQPILTLAEAMNAIDGQTKINIEIKSKGCAQAVAHNIERLVKNGLSYDHFLVSAFRVQRLKEVHRLNSKIPLGLLHFSRPLAFLKIRGLRIQAVGFYHRMLPGFALRQAQVRELFIYAYTVNNRRRVKQLLARGVEGIVTDRPDRLVILRGAEETAEKQKS